MNKSRLIKSIIIALSIMSVGAFGLWIATWNVSGSFIGSGGTSEVITEYYDFNISSTGNTTHLETYDNPNGVKDIDILLEHNLTSSDVDCTYEEGKDYVFYAEIGSLTIPLVKDSYESGLWIDEGSNNITIHVQANEYRCPVNDGWYRISFEP